MSLMIPEGPERMKLIRTGIWAGLIAFVVMMGCMTALAWFDKDFTGVMVTVGAFVMNALGFLIYGKVAQVKDLANGQVSRLADMVDRKTLPHPSPPAQVNSDDNT